MRCERGVFTFLERPKREKDREVHRSPKTKHCSVPCFVPVPKTTSQNWIKRHVAVISHY